jgi:serine/threonine protein kinase
MASEDPIGLVVDNKYRVEKLLGRGGMGAVYLATHLGTDRPVALKVIVPQFMGRDEFVERFRREAKAAGGMRHPNVVDVTDFGFATVGNAHVAYLVMEYLDGCSLADILVEESRLPTSWVVDIVEQVCAAVNEAHKRGIVHRDLKPDNIWLEPNRRGGYTVKVLDFGLAKLTGEGRAGPGSIVDGSSAKVSPKSFATQTSVDDPGQARHTVANPRALTRAEGAGTSEGTETQILEAPDVAVTSGGRVGDEESATMLIEPTPPSRPVEVIKDNETQILADPASTMSLSHAIDTAEGNGADADAATQMLFDLTMEANQTLATAPAGGLTRVGSVIGTPLYMSPEQCRGEDLDTRSDIYSIGVIAYQMLTGRPPFTGSALDIINQHMTAAPAPIKQFRKKIPRLMARTVMAALEKDPARRPQSAAAFASAMRASLDVTGALFRHGLAVYSELFPKLFKVSLLANLPAVLVSLTGAFYQFSEYRSITHTRHATVAVTSTSGGLTGLLTFLASTVVFGVTIRLVTQTYVAPLRPANLKPALLAVKRRIWALLWTAFLVVLGFLIGLCLLVIPGVIFYVGASLTTPVIIMENLKGRKAIRRSMQLVNRSRRTVVAILLLQYFIPQLAAAFGLVIIVAYFKGLNPEQAQLTNVIAGVLNIFIVPFIATLNALLYLKVRMAGGEILDEMLGEFAREDIPRTKWQMRMRSSATSA